MMMKSEDYNNTLEHQKHNVITNSTHRNTPSTQTQIYQTYPSYLTQPHHFLSHPPHHNSQTTPPFKHTPTTTTSSEECGGTIELSRRPRGRPPGSKNKAKPAIVINSSLASSKPAMSPYILELPPSADLVESLQRLTRRRHVSLCVLTATGAVHNVTLRQPQGHGHGPTGGGTVTFHGRFDILSMSACILYSEPSNAVMEERVGGFTISLAGPQGQIVGGRVVGPLVCATTVYVVATSFSNPSYCKLPLEGEVNEEGKSNNEGEYNYNGENCGDVSSGQNMGNLVNYG